MKRSAFALGSHYLSSILFEWLVFWGAFEIFGTADAAFKAKGFMPLESMYKLIDQPIQRIVMSKMPDKTEIAYDFAVHWYEIAIVLGWTALFIFLSYRLLKKRDL